MRSERGVRQRGPTITPSVARQAQAGGPVPARAMPLGPTRRSGVSRMMVPDLANAQGGDNPADNDTGTPVTPTEIDAGRNQEAKDALAEEQKVEEGRVSDCLLFGDC